MIAVDATGGVGSTARSVGVAAPANRIFAPVRFFITQVSVQTESPPDVLRAAQLTLL
ncbi:hypothetical protein PTE31013_04279 [Pandoraea terrigena]|uniref:Uncharacterized protein n=1 Tax=Pandoraea terrigena TaxID=2508292 RepID=A0A5E4Y3C5_9BURK|nr:hypothetical protein PTE31013_04279 [Pandoraea terrigena]